MLEFLYTERLLITIFPSPPPTTTRLTRPHRVGQLQAAAMGVALTPLGFLIALEAPKGDTLMG